MPNHGGKRKGAGKPALYGERMEAVEFVLPKEAIEFFTLLGDGNRSEGARRAWRSLTQPAPDKGDSPRQSSFINPEADTAQGALS